MDCLPTRTARTTPLSSQSALAPPSSGSVSDQLSEYVPLPSSNSNSSKVKRGSISKTTPFSSSPRSSINKPPSSSFGNKRNTSTATNVNDRKTIVASSHSISTQEIDAAFELVDANNDGSINAEELQHMLAVLGIQTDKLLVDQMIVDVAPEGNGLINKTQFERLLSRFGQVKDREEEMHRDLRAAFQVFDRDGNGFISRDELKAAMSMLGEQLSEQHLDQLMRETDLDHDGRIDFNEFCIKFRQLF